MKNICLRLCGISMAVMSLGTGIAHASPTTLPASGVTQTHATLSGTGATGFQVKYGKLTELDEIAQNALSPDSDPVAFTLDRYPWKKRNGWIESYYNTSSPLPVNTGSAITAEVTLTEETTVSFEWGVDSEEGIGNLSFIVDGQTLGSISGLVDFTGTSFTIAPGTHTLKWEYRKTAVTNVGMDLAKLRNIDLRNTTPGEWISMDAQGGSVTVDDLYPGQDYIFRAVDASGNRSGLKQFRTLDITIGDMTIDPITQTTATVSTPLDYGDASIETGFEFWRYDKPFEDSDLAKGLLHRSCLEKGVVLSFGKGWHISSNAISFNGNKSDGTIIAEFTTTDAGKISFNLQIYYATLDFYVDDELVATLSDSYGNHEFDLTVGAHVLRWEIAYFNPFHGYVYLGSLYIPNLKTYDLQSISVTPSVEISTVLDRLTPNSVYNVRPIVKPDYESRFEQRWSGDSVPYKTFTTLPVTADTLSVSELRQASVTLRGKVVGGDAEIIARGLQYKDATGARWTDFPAEAAAGEEISTKVTRLRPATKYDYRAYIQANGCDTVFSVTGSFTTEAVQALKPVLVSSTQHTAKIQGEIVAGDAQIYQRGMQFASVNSQEWEDFEDDGANDKFILERTGLDYRGAYKARTYVQPAGCDIIYSDTLKFFTKSIEAQVDSVRNVMQRTATLYCHTDGGDHGIDKRYYRIYSEDDRFSNKRMDAFEKNFFSSFMPFDYEVIQNAMDYGDGHLVSKQNAKLKIKFQTFIPGQFSFFLKGIATVKFYINGVLNSTIDLQETKDFVTSDIFYPGAYELEWDLTDVNEIYLRNFRINSDNNLPIESTSDAFTISLSGLHPQRSYGVALTAEKSDDKISVYKWQDFTTTSYFTEFITTGLTQSKATLQAYILPTNDTPEEMGFIYTDDAGNSTRAVGSVTDGWLTAEISGLSANRRYRFSPYAKVDGYVYKSDDESHFTTPPVDMKVVFSGITQTKANMTISCDKGDASVEDIQYRLDYGDYMGYTSPVSFTSLTPSHTYNVYVQARVNGTTYYFGSYPFKTLDINVSSTVDAAQTSAFVKVFPAVGDATLVASGIEYSTDMSYDNRIECDGNNTVLVTELDPATTYYYRAWAETAEGATAVKEGTFRTSAITCQTSAADNISNRSARLNGMIDCDANSSAEFGFEWKRMTGWASDPAFTKGIKNEDGTISVSLINGMLDPDTDYQFRAAVRYKGKMYHASEWKNFRTENEFILYPGTVYTLYRTDRENNAIIFCGYYVAGSETVTAQGYEYWHNGGASAPAMNAPATVETVYTGEDMQYTLPAALLADGNYSVRAFIETESGKTYGQTLSFGIENGGPSAIIDIESAVIQCRPVNGQIVMSNVSGLAVRICDTTGRTIFYKENLGETEYFDAPRNTICLLRFSNGMTFKIMP